MSRLLEDQVHFLELFRTTNKLQRKGPLETIDKPQLKALSEIAHNIIKGSVTLNPNDKKKLKKYKKILSILGKKTSTRRVKLQVLQRGTRAILHLLNVVDHRLWRK